MQHTRPQLPSMPKKQHISADGASPKTTAQNRWCDKLQGLAAAEERIRRYGISARAKCAQRLRQRPSWEELSSEEKNDPLAQNTEKYKIEIDDKMERAQKLWAKFDRQKRWAIKKSDVHWELDTDSSDDEVDLNESDDENENETNEDLEVSVDSTPPESEDEHLKGVFPWLHGETINRDEDAVDWDEVGKRPLY
jgi:hypothetical protein